MKAIIYLILIIFAGIIASGNIVAQFIFSIVMLAITSTITPTKAKVKKINNKHIGEELK